VNPAQRDGQAQEAIEHLLGASQGGVSDEGGDEDELAEPAFGDRQMEEDSGVGGGRWWAEGRAQGVQGDALLLVNELATDVVVSGQARDTAALVKGIQGEVDALAGGHGAGGAAVGGLRGRLSYNGHGLASGSSRAVLIPSIYRRQAFTPLPCLQFVTRI